MKTRNLRSLFLDGVSRWALTADDGAGDGGAGGGGAAPAPAAAPADDGGAQPDGGDGGGAPDGGEAGAGDAAGEGGDAAGDGDEPPAPPKTRTPWTVKRIDQLTATSKAAAERAERAEAEAANYRSQVAAYEALYGKPEGAAGAPPAAAPAAADPAARTYTQAEVQEEARRIASLQTLNTKCETLFNDGAKKHGDAWKAQVDAAGQAFGADLRQRGDFFQALTDLPNGADVYHQLTGDLDHFAEVLAMGPVQLGMELAGLSAKANAKPKGPAVSRAPAPIEPIDGSGGNGDTPLEKLSMADYAKVREKQREERMAARR